MLNISDVRLALLAASLAGGATPALADALGGARRDGLVCERTDGLLDVRGGDRELRDFVGRLNGRRSEGYARLAAEARLPVHRVAEAEARKLASRFGVCPDAPGRRTE